MKLELYNLLQVSLIMILPSSFAFVVRPLSSAINKSTRLFLSTSSTVQAVEGGISRLSTLQDLLSKHGAPGSDGCNQANDLEPVTTLIDTPELLSSLTGQDNELSNLHPYLFPIAKSKESGNFICALRSPSSEVQQQEGAANTDTNNTPWPIVESKLFGPGMKLLALNSEHLMRRIACESDFCDDDDKTSLVPSYNDGLGKGLINDAALDTPYKEGDVAKLGYGVEKYVLLRVGPFPDLYETMSLQHQGRGDESSSLIAAETSNGKFGSFASTYRFYARLLSSTPLREEEARDAARMCLRMPLTTIGLSLEDFKETAVLGQLADADDSVEDSIDKLREMYEKIRLSEKEDPQNSSGMTPEQVAIDEAKYVLDTACLSSGNCNWSEVRSKLGTIYRAAGLDQIADFVDPN